MTVGEYPEAKRLDLVEEIHGVEVADPYRWLEDASTDETEAWSKAQDELVRPYLDSLPGREHLRRRLRELIPGSIGAPVHIGDRVFFTRREPGQDHAVVFVRDADGSDRALVDPNAIDPDGTTTLDAWNPSRDGALLGYQLSTGGDERSRLRVLDVATGDLVEGPIDRTRYSPVAWLPDQQAYFYVRNEPPDRVPDGEDDFHRRVWFHRVGADPDTDDLLVYGEGDDKTAFFNVTVSHHGRWLVLSRSLGTETRNDVYLADLAGFDGSTAPTFTPVIVGEDGDSNAWIPADGRMYVQTTWRSPRSRLCVTDPSTPTPEHWRELLPETELVLGDITLVDGAIVACRTRHAVTEMTIHDRDTGAAVAAVDLPGLGVAGSVGRPGGVGTDAWIVYSDFTTPAEVLHLDVPANRVEPYAEAPGAFEILGVVAELVPYTSADGTTVHLFLIRSHDTPADGVRPTILYGYGGFDISQTPGYSAGIVTWVEAGGVYAVAQLRGGGEEGEEWHRAGMRERKQNVFDDFAAAARHLIDAGWTSPDHLGIAGGSNGGLLVGAALTQHPDLYRAVLCSAPLLDMVRYEHFGLGPLWTDEYGTVADATEFGWLHAYSPYHRVREGTRYPAVLFTVFESDSRVDPLHARKLCAALQHATAAAPDDRPILIRREVNVGHSARSLGREIELAVDTRAFMAAQLGLDF